jgi:hypothetical protein
MLEPCTATPRGHTQVCRCMQAHCNHYTTLMLVLPGHDFKVQTLLPLPCHPPPTPKPRQHPGLRQSGLTLILSWPGF